MTNARIMEILRAASVNTLLRLSGKELLSALRDIRKSGEVAP